MAVRYATRTDLAAQLTALRLTALAAGSTTVQDACIERAAGEVDLYLAASPTPEYASLPDYGQQIVRDLTVAIACYYLADRLGAVTGQVRQGYDDAIFRLKDIARGLASLGRIGVTAAPAKITIGSADRVFRSPTGTDSGTMGGW